MQLGQGCQRRTPWWCWLLAGLAAAATWPGAAFVVTADDGNAAPLAIALDGAIDLDKEPKLGLVYRVRVLSGAEDDLRTLAQKLSEKLIAKPGEPVVVEHDALLRLLNEAQTFQRLNLKTLPVVKGRGSAEVSIGDTTTFAVPVETTAADGTITLHEQSREQGWRLTMQPDAVGIESLRLHVINELTRLNDDTAVEVRLQTTGEDKLIPGFDAHRINTTVELKHAQHVVFPITKVPDGDSRDVMLVMMQASLVVLDDSPQQPEPTPKDLPEPAIRRGVGVNSDAGVTGQIVYEKIGEAPAIGRPHPLAIAAPAKQSERQILLQFHVYEVDEDGLKELGIKLGRAKTAQNEAKTRTVAPFQGDQDAIAKLGKMVHEKRVKVLSNPTIQTLDGHTANFLCGGEFPVPAVVGVGDTKDVAASLRGFGLQLTTTPTIVGPDSLRVSFTWSDSRVANEQPSGATAVTPTLISQSIQSELLVKPKQPVLVGPLGEPGAKGKQRIATLVAEIVETEPKLPMSGEKTKLTPAPVSVQFDNVPLKDAIKQLAQSTGRNIVLEKLGLEEEGLTDREPVTLSVEQIKLSSVLTLLLAPLRLGYRVDESGVIVVTSQQRLKGQPIVVNYAVADLAVPMPKRMTVKLAADLRVAADESKPSGSAKPTILSIRELVDFITSTCQPDSWEEVAGIGSIKINETTLSLVVRQTRDVHDEIRDLLGQLRRLQDLQAALHVETLTVPANFWSKVGRDFDLVETVNPKAEDSRTLWQFRLSPNGIPQLGVPSFDNQPNRQPQDKPDPQRVARLTKKESALLRGLVRPESAPKVTLFNSQELELFFDGESSTMRLGLKPIVSADRKGLRLQVAATKPDAELDFEKIAAITLESEHSLLLDVTDVYSVGPKVGDPKLGKVPGEARLFKNTGKSDYRTLLLITGQVVIVEEEQAP